MDLTILKNNLEKNGFKVTCFDNKEEAASYLDKNIDNTTVGFGGSVTLDEMGLRDRLSSHNTVYQHMHLPEGADWGETVQNEAKAEVYLTSANAVAETGEIINIDGTGNRIGSTCFGHRKLYFVIGENKIAPDYEKALWRARNIASPKNAKRLGMKTPCAVKADKCYNCNSPERICRALTVHWKNLFGSDTEIILIRESLGY